MIYGIDDRVCYTDPTLRLTHLYYSETVPRIILITKASMGYNSLLYSQRLLSKPMYFISGGNHNLGF